MKIIVNWFLVFFQMEGDFWNNSEFQILKRK